MAYAGTDPKWSGAPHAFNAPAAQDALAAESTDNKVKGNMDKPAQHIFRDRRNKLQGSKNAFTWRQ
jgi:hypothetical protein